jgi:molybdopterin-containing oxidoreductase family iron-sulfur binding subunit
MREVSLLKYQYKINPIAMKKYWRDIDSKHGTENLPEKPEKDDTSAFSLFDDLKEDGSASRRDFLKLCGFSFAVTAMASCQTKIRKAVPYVVAPYEITPGKANYYASTYMDGSDYCSIIVKTREGRPIKIEGNPASGVSMGGTSARVQASVLDLYDTSRFTGPMIDGAPSDWESVDAGILDKLCDWVRYDARSASAILEANEYSFGKQVIPDYRFDKAEVIVSLGADFLSTWLSPVEYTRQFSSRRDPDGEMSKLVMFESNLSLTGSNADRRIQIKPSQESSILLNIYKEIIKTLENRSIDAPPAPVDVAEVSKELLAAGSKSLVV